jgi:polar amino acid transport system substrate-binding protein
MALAGAVAPAAAEPGCSRPITVAAAPLGRSIMITPEGTVTGAQYDLLKRAGAAGHCEFDPVVVPWARALMMLQDGAVDLLPGAVWSAERDRIADFIVVDRVWPMLMSLREHPLGIDSRAALAAGKARLGVVRGFDYGAEYRALLDELERQDRLDRAADAETLARQLAGGRIDAVLMVPLIFADPAEKLGLGDRLELVRIDGVEPVRAGIYLSRTRLDPADRTRIAEAIRAAEREEGGYLGLLRHYYPDWALIGVEEGARLP